MVLLAGKNVVYELKTVASISTAHQSRFINYLLLSGIHHGKVINFRRASLESRSVFTNLNPVDRLNFQLSESEWLTCEKTLPLRRTLIELLEDLGNFPDIWLYREALLYLLQAPELGYLPIPLHLARIQVGFQEKCFLNSDHARHLSAIKIDLRAHEINPLYESQ